jgi:hypothetical protein
MARLPIAALRNMPWARVLLIARILAREGPKRWNRLTKREQQDLVRILRKSRGLPGNLTAGERDEVRRIVWKAVGPAR